MHAWSLGTAYDIMLMSHMMTIFLEGCSKAELNALERAYLNERSQATDENLNLVRALKARRSMSNLGT